jgi:hypothetical protein
MYFAFFFLLNLIITASQSTFIPPPTAGLSSNSNYFLQSNGSNLQQLTLRVTIDDPLFMPISGANFGLNCFSPTNGTNSEIVWQQFEIQFFPETGELVAGIFTWNKTGNVFQQTHSMGNFSLGNPNVVAAGTQMQISLIQSNSSVITGANFSFVSEVGPENLASSLTINILPTNGVSGRPATSNELAPITAFTTTIVAAGSGNATSNLTGGNGTFTYSATNPLAPVNALPPGLVFFVPEDRSNAVYGPMSGIVESSLEQAWAAYQ